MSLLIGLLLGVSVGVSDAGTFEVTHIYFKKQASPLGVDNTYVMVGAWAKYEGHFAVR